MRFSRILFDLDGTLTDPREGIVKSIRAALHEASLPTPSPHELERCIGPPLQQSFLELGARPDQVERLIEIYRTRYREVGMFENSIYPEIPELLETLASRGCQLMVATSKPTPFAEAVLDHFGLRDFFAEVYGSRLDGRLAEKRELVIHIRTRSDLKPSDTALIGDRKFDITAARAESWYSVGALWGYGTREELVAARADALAVIPLGVLDALAQ